MDTKTRILEAATELLAASPIADISTRAVCEAAGVGAPVLYRHFGDKEGLIAAVVDHAFERYLASKRAARQTSDPVLDLRKGWDNHVAFAVANPNYYRLMYAPVAATPPQAATEAHRMLTAALERCAAAGRLRVSPEAAAQMVMSANVGVALMLITRPELFPNTKLSTRVRDSIHASILTPDDDVPASNDVAITATTLGSLLRSNPPTTLTPAETALFHQWLGQLTHDEGATHDRH